MKNQIIINFVVFFLCVTGSVLFAEGKQEPLSPEEKQAKIEYVEGTVLLNGSEADFGDIVPAGATIETKAASACDVVFGRGNIFRIEENTITTVSIEPGNSEIDLQKGSIDAVFGKLKSFGIGEDDFIIRTPSIVAGVRGTVFYVKIEDPNTTYFCTCHGKIHQNDPANKVEQTVTSYHHKAYRYTRSGGRTEVVEEELLYHDDAAMEVLADKIDVTIPWNILRRDYY